MATLFIEPGGDADFGIGFWPNHNTAPVVATDFVHGGHIKSIKYASNVFSYNYTGNILSDTGGRVSMYIYINAWPSGSPASMFSIEQANDGNTVLGINVTSAGVLQLIDFNGAQQGVNGTTLSLGTWYRLSFAWKITSTTVNEFRLFRDGVSDISLSNATLPGVATQCLQVGNAGNLSFDFRSSDHYIDNSNLLTDPGNIWVTAKRPNANGTSIQFTTQIGAGGSGYGTGHSPQVNERPISSTNGWSLTNTTKSTEEYNIENAATGDLSVTGATIIDYMGWLTSSVNSTLNSPVHHIIVNGVATAITESTSQQLFTKIAASTTYPAGTGTDIGIDAQFTTTGHLTSLFDCGIIMAYIPAVAAPSTQFMRRLMGIGL